MGEGPASSGVLNAFSQETVRGSSLVVTGVGLGTDGAMLGPGWDFSILSSATCDSRMRFRFIRFSSIWRARSRRMPGLNPLWNLNARVTASAAMITSTAMSMVLNESCGNF